jgi:hypothetical protein
MPEEFGYTVRTFQLKTKDGIFAWLYKDGTERFPGMVFPTREEAEQYFDKQCGNQFVVFEKRA